MSDAGVTSIVLAAGLSTRLPGRNKLLLPVDGTPVVRRVVEALLGARAGPVVVVVGHQAEAVIRALEALPVRFATNARYAEGMGTSIAAGVAVADPGAEGYLICLGDLPGLNTAIVETVVDAFVRNGSASIVAPLHAGRRGHPVLFPASYRRALLELSGDRGARDVVREGSLLEVPVDDPGVVADVDTLDDYRRLRRNP